MNEVTRKTVLAEAERCVCGQREDEYGNPEDNFETIGLLWSVYIRAAHPEMAMAINGIKSKDVAIMMALLKVARIASGKTKADNYIDLAGYAACAGEIAHKGLVPQEESHE